MKQEQDTLKQRIRSGKIRPADVTRRLAELAFGKANDCVRLALEDAPEPAFSGSHTVHVVTEGGTEVYGKGYWTSVRRKCDSRGILQTRTMQCWSRTTE